MTVELGQSEEIQAGAMGSHTDGIAIETGTQGGIVDSLKRTAFGRESFFMNTFSAERPGHITITPPLPGDEVDKDLQNERLLVQSGSFLAAEAAIDIDTKFGGGRTFFGGEGLVCEFQGEGAVWLQTRSTDALLSWLIPNLLSNGSGDNDSGLSIDF